MKPMRRRFPFLQAGAAHDDDLSLEPLRMDTTRSWLHPELGPQLGCPDEAQLSFDHRGYDYHCSQFPEVGQCSSEERRRIAPHSG